MTLDPSDAIEDPLGDIGLVVRAAERLADYIIKRNAEELTQGLDKAWVVADAETVKAVCGRLKGRL